MESLMNQVHGPSDLVCSPTGEIFVAEAGESAGSIEEQRARIVQIMPNGSRRVLYDRNVPQETLQRTDLKGYLPEGLLRPLTGLTWHDDMLYVTHGTRVSRLDPKTGEFATVVNLKPEQCPAGKVAFDQDGTMILLQARENPASPTSGRLWRIIPMEPEPQQEPAAEPVCSNQAQQEPRDQGPGRRRHNRIRNMRGETYSFEDGIGESASNLECTGGSCRIKVDSILGPGETLEAVATRADFVRVGNEIFTKASVEEAAGPQQPKRSSK